MAKKDFYTEISEKIAAQLKSGAAPWVKPWASHAGSNIPVNAITNRPYNGGNVIIIWMAMNAGIWALPRFLTFKQAKDAGGTVRRGEKGITVFFMKKMKYRPDDLLEKEKEFMMVKTYTVFNVEQCEGLSDKIRLGEIIPVKQTIAQRNDLADEFVKSTMAKIKHGGDRAFYIPSKDFIQMPFFKDFKGSDHYYATQFHELGHWTGAKHRLDRDLKGRFGDEAYAAEELIAELTAAFLSAEFSFDGDLRHAGYIDHWIKLIKNDKRAFFTAASKAQQAANYLRGFALTEEEIDQALEMAA